MKVIIAGSRTITDFDLVAEAVRRSKFPISEVVCGCAFGVDGLGREYSQRAEIGLSLWPAQWDKHGRSAGPIRNQAMANYADALILVWGGKSRGSRDMLNKAKAKGLKIYEEIVP